MNESDSLCPVCSIRFVLGCECNKMNLLHVAIHSTTENKIGWGNLEYDVRMVFSETTGVICRKARYPQKKTNISLS